MNEQDVGSQLLERIFFLRKIHLFTKLPSQILSQISFQLGFWKVMKNEWVIKKEQKRIRVYFLINGTVEIINNVNPKKQIVLNEPGIYFGEQAVIDNKPHPYEVKAIEESKLYYLNGEDFKNLLEIHEAIRKELIKDLCRKIRKFELETHITHQE